ncbi:MAG: copper-binding protein, partial [Ottowia sp.]|nr:copper-binding protein [Ottowia sp.]
ALAQQPAPGAHAAQSAAEWTRGEVRRVDAAAGKLTLRHEEIRHLDMPGMTMVFEARDKALLPGLKAGDTVRFQAADEQGRLVITALERMP